MPMSPTAIGVMVLAPNEDQRQLHRINDQAKRDAGGKDAVEGPERKTEHVGGVGIFIGIEHLVPGTADQDDQHETGQKPGKYIAGHTAEVTERMVEDFDPDMRAVQGRMSQGEHDQGNPRHLHDLIGPGNRVGEQIAGKQFQPALATTAISATCWRLPPTPVAAAASSSMLASATSAISPQ